MYNVYLVDDEPLVLEDMKTSIPWQEYAFGIAGASTDPLAAREEILALQPEAVFTDIRMPTLSGLELIGTLREAGMECEFVLISAHESFEYARQLILHGGFDYLIKPVERIQYDTLLPRLLARLEQRYPRKGLISTPSPELNDILRHLHRNLSQKHSLGELADAFNFSTGHICHLFTKHLGTTFSAYLTALRMETAARLLQGTTKPVKVIAAETGYEDYFYFCRVFRETYAMPPTRYRREG